MDIVFLGTAAFAVPTLRALREAGHHLPLVVTQPDRPAGRGLRLTPSPVKRTAQELGLELFQPEAIRDPRPLERIRALAPEALVVVAYGQILPSALLELPRLGAFNLHASLLPRHRGPAPIPWAILSADARTGVTVIRMDAGVDTGPILAQRAVEIGAAETVASLEERLASLGAGLMVDTLAGLQRGAVRPVPQPLQGVTHAPALRSQDGQLSLRMPAAEIDRRVRALTPSPGCWITLRGSELKVLRGHVATDGDGERAGGGVRVETVDGVYVIDEVQPPGGRPMAAAAWARGRR